MLLGETFKEEENDRLQEMLDANFTILLDKRNESLFIVFPCLYNVVFFFCVEECAKKDPVAEFRSKTLRSSNEL